MAPPAKKAKKSNDEPAMPRTVVFAARGLESDVRLRVFNTDFYVHSTMLKLHSAFFFKFLDSPDKPPTGPVGPRDFKYKWITKIDEDGSWSLVDARSVEKHDTQFDEFKGDKMKDIIVFEKLLKAIYGEDYEVLDVEELIAMTKLADYYCALPALSRSLYRALYAMDLDVAGCKEELLPKVLAASCKLRYPDLFKECIILAAGKWSNNYGRETPLSGHSRKIRKLIEATRHRIGFEVAKANEQMLRIFSQSAQLGDYLMKVDFKADMPLPEYYRDVYSGNIPDEDFDHEYEDDECKEDIIMIERALGPVLENNLKFSGRDLLPGKAPFEKHFLFATISDDDLPWDDSQTDW